MNIIEFDAGNSRLKWRFQSQSGDIDAGACDYQHLATLLPKTQRVQRVRIACVAGEERLNLLQEFCRQRWNIVGEVAVVLRECAGVRQAYHDPSRLGVDRWLALLAAYNEFKRSCVVVSCGTAITVDLMDADGVHRGGYIVPGFELMRKALFSGTHAVKVPPLSAVKQLLPGRSTEDAVANGLLKMVVELVVSSVSELDGSDVKVILSGGDARHLVDHLPLAQVVERNQLVLDGLAYALP